MAAILGALMLAGCVAGPTPYVAADPTVAIAPGYADAALEDDRFRITYTASARTPAALVEDYLLHRAAEVTLAEGADWFRLDRAETVPVIEYFATAVPAPVFSTRLFVVRRFGKALDPAAWPDALPATRGAVAAVEAGRHYRYPRWPYRHWRRHRHRRRAGVALSFGVPLYLGPYGYPYGPYAYPYGPYYPHATRIGRRVSRLEALAEIRIFTGTPPEDDADAYDARAVIEAIGPRLPRPGEDG